MTAKEMAELFSLIFGGLISYGFKVIPALDVWYQTKLDSNLRGLFMLGLSLLAPLSVLAVSCAGIFNLVQCNTSVLPDMGRAWIYFVSANVGIFMMTKESKQTTARKTVVPEKEIVQEGQ